MSDSMSPASPLARFPFDPSDVKIGLYDFVKIFFLFSLMSFSRLFHS